MDGGRDVMPKAREPISQKKLRTEIAGELESDKGREALGKACNSLGYDYEHMLWAAREFALRNQMFHSDAKAYARGSNWCRLAEQISLDFEYLPALEVPKEEAKRFEKCIQNIRDRYFVNTEADPLAWRPSEYAEQRSRMKEEKENATAD